MKRLLISAPIAAAVVAAAVLLGANVLGGQGGGSGDGEYGTLYIDAVPDADNTTTGFGTVEVCRDTDDLGGPLDVGDSFTIDIVVDDATEPIVGAQWKVNYGPTVLRVTASDWASWKLGSDLRIEDGLPDSDGGFDTASVGSAATGDGVLQRLTLEAVASGQSDLTLSDVAVSDADNAPRYPPQVLVDDPAGEVRVVVGGSCPPGGEGAGATPTPEVEATPEQEGEAEAVRVRWGNISLEQPPSDSEFYVGRWFNHGGIPGGRRVPVVHLMKRDIAVHVIIDAETGQVLHDTVGPEERAAFDAILATLRIEGEEISAWPYGLVKPDVPRSTVENISYLEPDPASGIVAGVVYADFGPDGSQTILRFQNVRSMRDIDADTSEILPDRLMHPDDREAFDRLTAEVKVVVR